MRFSGFAKQHAKLQYRRQFGFTLIELLLVISIAAALMTGLVGLQRLIAPANKEAANRSLARQEILRFTDRFNDDASQSANVVVTATGCELTPNGDRGLIRYEADNDSIRRLVRRGNTLQHQDRFLLQGRWRAQFIWLPEDSLVRCQFETTVGKQPPIVVDALTLEATP